MNHQRKTEFSPKSVWGQWVLEVLERHHSGFRQQRQRTGIPHSTVVNWVQDIPPRMDGVIAFAQGMGEDVNQALALAGYDPIQPPSVDAAADQLLDVAARVELTYEPELDEFDVHGIRGMENVSGHDKAVVVAFIRRMLQRERERQGRG